MAMTIRNCNFCGTQIEPGTGILYVRKDGNTLNFCTRKCQVNMVQMKRVPRRVKWTNEYHTIKEMRKSSSKN